MSTTIAGIKLPDSKMACKVIELIRDTESDLLYHHSTRVYFFGAFVARHRGLAYDAELFFAGAMFHDIGLTEAYRGSQLRFEVDGANAARTFLRAHGIPEASLQVVWDAIALHTTPGIPEHKQPEVALVNAGVELDVLGRAYHDIGNEEREAVVAAYPRGDKFKCGIIDTFYQGMKHRPGSTFGTMNDDVLAYKDPAFQRQDFCQMIMGSAWES